MRKEKRVYYNPYFVYTIIFMLLLPCIYASLLLEGKSFILWGGGDGDGISQHYTALVYLGQWMREVLYMIFVEHSLAIPMCDMSIGYGADIITTLSYYTLGDPFALLSVFFPPEKTEYLYNFLIVFRLWCAGMAFLYYCKYNESFDGLRDHGGFVLGAFIYVFSTYPLRVPHPYFVNPMIWFPLVLVGIDKILRGDSPLFYIGMLAVSAVSNFYFFYMICIMVVIYTTFRYFMIIKDKRILVIAAWVGKFLAYSLWSVGISMVLLLPTMISMLSSNRISAKREIPLIYPLSYYRELLGTMIAPTINNYYTYLGYASIAVLAIGLLLIDKKERLWAKYFGVLTTMLLLPYMGYAMNGFVYVTNRWIWAYCFLVAYITVKKLPELLLDNGKIKKGFWLLSILYIGIVLMFRQVLYTRVIAAMILLVLQLLIIWLGNRKKIRKVYVRVIVFVLVIFNLIMNSYFMYFPEQGNYVAALGDKGTAWKAIGETANSMMENIPDKERYRYDTRGLYGAELMRNSAMLKGIMGTSSYFSTSNNSVTQYQREMYLCNPMDQSFENLEGRSFLAALASVKYKIVHKDDKGEEDYCFTDFVKENEKYTIYADPFALPMAYSYDSWIPRSSYDEMDVTKQQEAMLQGVVLDGESGLKKTDIIFQSQALLFDVIEENGLEYHDGEVIVKENDASLTLEFDGLPESETYVIFQDIHYHPLDSGESIFYQPQLSWKTKVKNTINYFSGFHTAYISVYSDPVRKGIEVYTEENSYYCGHHDYLCNLGYRKDKVGRVTLNFSLPGIYKMDELSITCQPVKELQNYKQKLNKGNLKLDQLGNNQYSCEMVSDTAEFICFSVPYNQGWSAKLDGKEIDIVRANTMFMGVEVPEGKHNIIISYRTPGVIAGFWISLGSLVIYIICLFCAKRDGINWFIYSVSNKSE